MSKVKTYNTTPITANFDDSNADAKAKADANDAAQLDVIVKKLDEFDTKSTAKFAAITEMTALKTELETFTKSATDLSDASKKQHDALLERFEKQEAQFKSLLPTGDATADLKIDFGADPSIKKKVEFVTFDDGQDEAFTKAAEISIQKAIDSPVSTPGATVTATRIITMLQTVNPLRTLGSVFPVGDGETATLPTVGGITFVPKKLKATKPTETGTLESRTVTVVPHVASALLDEFAAGNLGDLDRTIVDFMAKRAPRAEVTDAVNVFTEASATGAGKLINNVITTGTANKLTATAGSGDEMIKTLKRLADALTMEYTFDGVFLVSRTVMSLLQTATNNGYVFNPVNGFTTLFGYPMVQMAGFADGSANGQVSAVFGDFSQGYATVTKKTLSIARYEQTDPGYLTYHAAMSFKGTIWDRDALSSLITGA